MGNLRMITGGLALVVLALAGGTGYLIWERIQSEIGGNGKATRQEVTELAEKQVKTEKDVLDLKEQVRLHTVELETHRKELATAKVERDILREGQVQLRKDMETGDAESKAEAKKLFDVQQQRIDEMEKDVQAKEKRLKATEDQLAALGEKVGKIETDQVKMKQDIEKAAAERAEIKDETKKLREENEALKLRQEKLDAEIAEINKLLGRNPKPEE